MPHQVIVSATGQTATVSGRYHSTQIVGLEDAERWVAFYRRLAAGKSGRFYCATLAAFEDAHRQMRAKAGAA